MKRPAVTLGGATGRFALRRLHTSTVTLVALLVLVKGSIVYATIDPEGGRSLVRDGAVLLDIREANEWDAGHAPEAIHLAMSIIEGVDALPFNESDKVVVMCRSGRRSIPVTEYLQAKGYDAVNCEGGMQAWVQLGGAIVDAEGNTGIVL